MLGFTVMHSVFILYTEMDPANGGLGFSEQDNGRMFAMIGLLGIFTQAALIGPLTRKFGTRRLIPLSIILTGVGLVTDTLHANELGLASNAAGAFVHCDWQRCVSTPSSSTYLTRLAKDTDYDLGGVMKTQESLSALCPYPRAAFWWSCLGVNRQRVLSLGLPHSVPSVWSFDVDIRALDPSVARYA